MSREDAHDKQANFIQLCLLNPSWCEKLKQNFHGCTSIKRAQFVLIWFVSFSIDALLIRYRLFF
jgi:hypothetical protein